MTEQKAEYALSRTHATDIVGTFDDVARIGKAMAASGYFSDASDAAKAIVKILAGREMGFGPFAAMHGVHVIKGKPTVGANLMAAAVKNHPRYDYRVAQMSDQQVSITFYQNGDELGTSTFTVNDAKDAGLMGRDNWRKYARNMLFARAISNGVRWYCPDVFAGNAVYTPDELGADVDAEGDVVEGVVVEQGPEPEAKEPLPPQEEMTTSNDSAEPRKAYNGGQRRQRKPKSNGNGSRPYDPEKLREVIAAGIGNKRNNGFTFDADGLKRYRGAMNANLANCFAGDQNSEQKRHFVIEYLTGKASSTKLDDAEVKTIHRWLGATKDEQTGEWNPDPTAKIEAQAVARQAALDAGQQELGV